jgi:hypothetical protein
MATRALIRVIPRQEGIAYDKGHMYVEESLVNIYHHYDGNPEHLGVKLAKFLLPYKITNGVSNLNVKDFTHLANGPECLTAQLVKHLKTGDICDTVVGNVYLYPINPYKYDAEYIYTLYPKTDEPTYIAIYKNFDDKVIFVGTPDKLIKKYDRQRDKSISSTSS